MQRITFTASYTTEEKLHSLNIYIGDIQNRIQAFSSNPAIVAEYQKQLDALLEQKKELEAN